MEKVKEIMFMGLKVVKKSWKMVSIFLSVVVLGMSLVSMLAGGLLLALGLRIRGRKYSDWVDVDNAEWDEVHECSDLAVDEAKEAL